MVTLIAFGAVPIALILGVLIGKSLRKEALLQEPPLGDRSNLTHFTGTFLSYCMIENGAVEVSMHAEKGNSVYFRMQDRRASKWSPTHFCLVTLYYIEGDPARNMPDQLTGIGYGVFSDSFQEPEDDGYTVTVDPPQLSTSPQSA